MSPNAMPPKPLKLTLTRLSSAVSICCLALASGSIQAASCDYLPDQPADAQLSQCQSSAQAATGDARAELAKVAFDSGFLLESAKAAQPNLELSASYYRIAADLGSPGAQFNLANQIVRGGGDMSEAAKYFRLAAKQGAKLAQYNLATQYLSGQGVAKDPQKAYLWFRTAAGLGLAEAQFELANLFEQGLGVEKNMPSAIGWYELSANQGYAPAQQRVNQLKKNLNSNLQSATAVVVEQPAPSAPEQAMDLHVESAATTQPLGDETPAVPEESAQNKQSVLGSLVASTGGFFSGLIKPKNNAQPAAVLSTETTSEPLEVPPSSTEQDTGIPAVTSSQPQDQSLLREQIAVPQTSDTTPSDGENLSTEATTLEATTLEVATLEVATLEAATVTESSLPEETPSSAESAAWSNQEPADVAAVQSSPAAVIAEPVDVPAPEVLTSALPAADLPAPVQDIPDTPIQLSSEVSSDSDAQDQEQAQAQVNSTPIPDLSAENSSGDTSLTPSSPPLDTSLATLSAEQKIQAAQTPLAIEISPEQQLAAQAQSPEELKAILKSAPQYQVTRPDFPAERAYLRAAESGSELAQLALANAYAQGKGVPADSEAAAKWYLRSARQGNAEASLNLALSYKLGNGVKKNNEQALKWFKHSAFRGNAQALYNLGAIYASGAGAAVDEGLATRYFTQSANLGYEPAKNALLFMRR